MSMLERLQIRGIRNFGVDAEDEQKITFSTPPTLILGQNGSGKTTIIECIKYALTGEMPPNCKSGVGFINNPDVLHTSESMGQVKLSLKNLRGVDTTICRAGKVFKKNKKLQFKSLDVTITLNENGHEISTSKRIDDATVDMCTAMGVSKAIINHVLFCYQEESSWPLGTDAEVMKIFDEIFGTTEYNNALDKMRTMRKKYESKIKDQLVNLKEMEMIKQEADRKNMEINKHEEEVGKMKEKYDQYEAKLKPIKDDYKKAVEIENRLSSITASKAKAETELKNLKENAHALSSKIRDIFTGSDVELKNEIKLFKDRHQQKQTEQEDKEVSLQGAKYELDQISKKVSESDRKYHSLLQESELEQDKYAEKAEYIEKMSKALNINVDFDIRNSNDRAASLVSSIRTVMAKVNEKIDEIKANNEKLDTEQEKEIRCHREEEVRVKSEITLINKQLNDLENALSTLKSEIKKVEQSSNKLNDISRKISEIKSAREQLEATTSTQGLRGEISTHREEKQKLSDDLEDVDCQITTISAMASLLAEVTSKENQIKKRDSESRRIQNKHRESFQRLLPNETIETGIKRKIETLHQKLRVETNKLEAEIRLKENQALSNKSQLQNKKQDLTRLENELRSLEEEIEIECEQTPFVEALATTKENTEKYQMEYSALKSSDVFYTNYIKKMEDLPCCPLCHKDMNRNEVDDLTDELSDKLRMLPENIERSEQLLNQSRIKLEKLLGIQKSVDRVDRLKSSLIPQVKEDIKKLETDLSAIQEKINKAQQNLKEPKEKLGLIEPMIGDMSILEDALRDIEQNRIELEPLKRKLPSNEGQDDNNLDSLQKKRKEINDRYKYLEKEILRKEKQCDRDAEAIRKFKETEMKLAENKLVLMGDIQKIDGLKSREKELIEEIRQLKEKKDRNDQLLIPIQAKIRVGEEKRLQKRAECAEKLNREMKYNDGLKKDYNQIDRLTKELEKLAQLNLPKEIERYNKILTQLRDDQKKQTGFIESLREEIKLLTKELAEQKNTERDLNDNLELKKIEKNIGEKEKELETLRKHEREVDFAQILEKKTLIAREMEKIMMDRTRLDGQMNEKHVIIASLREETNKPKYRDSIRNYKKAFYENVVLKKTVQDLTTYCETLEKALTKFHSDKMEKINSLIRNLWRTIYKVNDIDYIQISTEEVKGTTKRRSYTYRVVASKNDTFMDFPGQSSAGQRVLACLIIRIALAETFSGHCGVLALDEPTTNLDRLNIEALCEALNSIVEEREGQSNFMLIVITHDEEFINALGRVMNYYRVFRDPNGKSRTQKLRVN